MINTSATFTELSRADCIKIYAKIVVNGQTTITNNDICNMVVEEQLSDNNIELGTAYSSVLKFDYYGNVDLVGKTLQPYMSYNNIEWCPLGKFKTVDIKSKDIGYEITAYDAIAFLTEDYTITTAKTFSQMITDFGLTLASGQTVPSVTISESVVGTQRDYLGWIAGYMGRNARINRYGNLEFVWFKDNTKLYGDLNDDGQVTQVDADYIEDNLLNTASDYKYSGVLGSMRVGMAHIGIPYNSMSGQADVNTDGIVNTSDLNEVQAYVDGTPYVPTKVGTPYSGQIIGDSEILLNGFIKSTLGTQTISALISGYGENVYQVGSGRYIKFSNPFITQAQLQIVWNEIITNSGFSWQPCEVQTFGNPSYEIGDIVYVTQDNTTFKIPLMSQKFEISESINTTLKSYGWSDEKAVVDTGTIDDRIDRKTAELQQEIERVTNELNNAEGVYGGTYEKIYATIQGNERPTGFKIINNTDSNKYWQFDYNGLRYTANNGGSFKVGISNSGSVLADNIVAGSVISNSFKIGSSMIFNGANDTITFGSGVTMSWDNITDNEDVLETSDITTSGGYVTKITNKSIQTDKISATAMSAINIDASQITSGTIVADAIGANASITTPTINLGTSGVIYGASYSTALYYDYTYGWYFSGAVTIGENASGANLDVGWNLYVGNQLSVYGNTFLHSTPSLSTSFTSIGVNASGQVGINGSARRFKNSIELVKDNSLNPKGLYDIDIVQFKWNEDMTDEPDRLCIGMIAEDVAEHFPIAVRYGEDGQVLTWETREFIAPIIKLLQEQNERITRLENENSI